jgi:hypothetical protein
MMKSSKAFAAIAVTLLVTVSLTAAPLQQAPPGGPPPGQAPERGGPGEQAPPGGGPAAQQQTATGQLAKVDAAKREITIKSGDREMVFAYTDATQISGVDGDAQGLTGKTGETLRVTYQTRGGANLASKIEVQEAKK